MLKTYLWSAIERLSVLLGNLFVFWFLALISGPEQFAPIAMLSAIMIVANAIAEAGMYTALIRLSDITRNDYAVAFVFNMVTSFVLTLSLVAFSTELASFLNQSILNECIQLIAPLCVIYAFGICYKVDLVKSMRIKSLAQSSLIAFVASIISLILCHFILATDPIDMAVIYYWFFISVSSVVYTIQSPLKLKMSAFANIFWKRSDDFYRFASTTFVVSLLNSLFTNAYTLLIGNLYTPRDLSYINQASRFSQIIPSNVSMIMSRANYPKLVSLRPMPQDFRYFLRLNVTLLTAIMVLVCGLSSILSAPIVNLLLGERWLEMIPILSILFLVMALIPINALWMQVVQTLGNSMLYVSIEVIKKINFAVMLYVIAGLPAIYFCYGLAITSSLALLIHLLAAVFFLKIPVTTLVLEPLKFIVYGLMVYFVLRVINIDVIISALLFLGTYLFIMIVSLPKDIKSTVINKLRAF